MKLTKHAEVLTKLHEIIAKQAEEKEVTGGSKAPVQKQVTGVPGKDTKMTQVSAETEKENKEQAGSPEKHPQGYEQTGSTDASKPVKSAEDLGQEILDLIKNKVAETAAPEVKIEKKEEAGEKKEEAGEAKKTEVEVEVKKADEDVEKDAAKKTPVGKGSGIPGKDTHFTSVKGKDSTNKEQAGSPEKHTQGYKQNVATLNAAPAVQHAKQGEDEELAAKTAAYELGRQLAIDLLKSASTPDESQILKEAGRRDFDVLIAQAAEQLQKNELKQENEKLAEALGAAAFDELAKTAMENELSAKVASYEEALGAAAFDELAKKAALENLAEENKQLKTKLASYEEVEQATAIKTAQQQLADSVTAQVINALKNTVAEK